MNKKIFITLIIIVSIFSIESCYYDNEEYLYPSASACDTTLVSYSNDIAPVISTHCFGGCHNGSNPTGVFKLETYADVQNKSGILVNALNGFGVPLMPPSGKLSACTINNVRAWVNQGALNN